MSVHSDVTYPSTDSAANGGNALSNAKDSFASNAQSAFNSVQNHPLTQNVKDTVQNGPVADSVRTESAKTSAEFRNLANSRTRPDQPAATGQPLTHYHSLFYSLLSWENPRATAISFTSTVLFIFAVRYIHIFRYIFKGLYVALGITSSAELLGKLVFNNGFASQLRPRKYYTIPKETLEQAVEDVQELSNFFVIEFQRVLFAENVSATIVAFVASLFSYWLVKFIPLWGLALISTVALYIIPLTYISNKETIDLQIQQASDIVHTQANQVKEIAKQHTARTTETVKSYAGDYSNKAHQYLGSARTRSTSPEFTPKKAPVSSTNPSATTPIKTEPEVSTPIKTEPAYTSADFPAPPSKEPTPIADQFSASAHTEPQTDGEAPVAAI